MKKTPKFGWRLWRTRPADNHGYHKLTLDIIPLTAPYTGKAYPLPVFDTGWNVGNLSLRWQGNAGDPPAAGTVDGVAWYGPHVEIESDNPARALALASWIAKTVPDIESPAAVVEALLSKGVPRVAYSCALSQYVVAGDWETAESYRCAYDAGARADGEGCTVNAYVPDGGDPVAAVSKALRESKYCTDEGFARWIAAGKQVRFSQSTGSGNHRPEPLTHYFGAAE